jgi:dihydroflavonol-4-reductase
LKILVTGATGFIGLHLVRRLATTNHQISCLVRPSSNVAELEKLGVTLVTGDVIDRASLDEAMKGCDWVANLANVYSFWEPKKKIYAEVNIEGTRNVMEAVLESGVSKVAHMSSVVTYGKPTKRPFAEETPVGPVRFSEYARTKYDGDLLAWRLYEERKLPILMIYPGAVVGPGDTKASGQYVLDLINRGLPTRVFDDSTISWVHVKDVAEVTLRALEKQGNVGEKYLVCGERLAMREFNGMVTEISGVALPKMQMPGALVALNAAALTALSNLTKKTPKWGMAADQMRTIKEGIEADGSKAERELEINYTPIRTALEEAIDWYRGRPS